MKTRSGTKFCVFWGKVAFGVEVCFRWFAARSGKVVGKVHRTVAGAQFACQNVKKTDTFGALLEVHLKMLKNCMLGG